MPIRVTVDEYGDYFESRYGLLYQKFNDKPFTGRILTIDKGESGEYVSSDESWTEGKKDGVSAAGSRTVLRCMKETTKKVAGMAL